MDLNIIYWLLVGVMFIGVLGALLPAIPGTGLILLAMLVWGILTKFEGMGLPLVVTSLILLLSIVVDFGATYWGVKRVGASKWSQIGAIIGLIVAFLGLLPALPIGGPIAGIFVGPFVGAFVGEFLHNRSLELGLRIQRSLKVSFSTIVGTVLGNVLKAILALTAVIFFLVTTWPPVTQALGV